MKTKIVILIIFCFIILYLFSTSKINLSFLDNSMNASANDSKENKLITIKETAKMSESNSDDFWLSSGGNFYQIGEYGRTIFGELPTYSRWRRIYNSTNPLDTDNGFHPQNLLRLIARDEILNSTQQFYFLIVQDNLSTSPNRNESNGIFTLNRYKDTNNLYYAGVRVDGTAVIKKKIHGIYHTLAQIPVFSGDSYNRNTNPNLLPKNKWIGMRANVINIDSNKVKIELFLDKNETDEWEKVLEVVDSGNPDIPAFTKSGHGGIRSDFMDIEIKNYSFKPL